jgi:hypothetical protein
VSGQRAKLRAVDHLLRVLGPHADRKRLGRHSDAASSSI